jgi:hypothetical protein
MGVTSHVSINKRFSFYTPLLKHFYLDISELFIIVKFPVITLHFLIYFNCKYNQILEQHDNIYYRSSDKKIKSNFSISKKEVNKIVAESKRSI